MSLPFSLHKKHKASRKFDWKRNGMIFLDDEHFEYIYNEYIHETHCDLCNKQFIKSQDRQLDHNHKTGEIRNIVCQKCNCIRKDRNQKRLTLDMIILVKEKIKNLKLDIVSR